MKFKVNKCLSSRNDELCFSRLRAKEVRGRRHVKNITYFKNFSKYFIRMKCFSMLAYTRETLMYKFEYEFRYNLCIAQVFK